MTSDDRVLVLGAAGRGKSTLVAAWAEGADDPVTVIDADPGRPGMGPPTALARVEVRGPDRRLVQLEAMATLNPVLFRLPWAVGLHRLVSAAPEGPVLIDAPGVWRSHAAAEMFAELARLARVNRAVVLLGDDEELDHGVRDALEASGASVTCLRASPQAKAAGRGTRRRQRSDAWRDHLEQATLVRVPRAGLRLVGHRAPERHSAWLGRAVGLLDADGRTVGVGEVRQADARALTVAANVLSEASVTALVMRDAGVVDGLLQTLSPEADVAAEATVSVADAGVAPAFTPRARPDIRLHLGTGPILQGASVKVTMVGGLFDDPMVVMRLDHRQRCLFFDLGEVSQVPTRLVHQANDVFVSHAHLDHFGGFPTLIRRRLGTTTPCRIIGPPGLAAQVEAMVLAFTWDRIDDRGPVFEIGELHGGSELRWWRMQCGRPRREASGVEQLRDGLVLDEPRFGVRAVELDHGTPVLAFAMEEPQRFDVRPDVLRERGWKPGPWLGELKSLAAQRRVDDQVELTLRGGGKARERVGALVDALLLARPGQKIVYATDFEDSAANREALVGLARGAHLMICEASFVEDDAEQAARTQHLTARSCAEIAALCEAELLVPFHLSSRYEERPEQIFAEILAVNERVLVPRVLAARLGLV